MMNAVDRLDVDKLSQYLAAQIEGFKDLIEADKFANGQSNPTFLLKAESGQYVLRRKPPGVLLKSAHAVDREFRVIKSLQGTGVPVPKAIHLCEDEQVIGSMFYIMSYEKGRIFWDAALPDLSSNERTEIHLELIRVLAALHQLNVETLGLGDYGKPGNYYERQIGRWSQQYRFSESHVIPAMENLIDWLPKNIPVDDGQISVIHGDFRLDNMIFDAKNSKVIAILDWELSTLGHPFADLAYYCMCLRMPQDGAIKGLYGVDRIKAGIPNEEDMVSLYCSIRGINKIDHWNFYLAFSFFRLAAICQGVFKRDQEGNASSKQAIEVGKMAEPLAQQAILLINK